ncbi:MAG: hypothetical protein ACKVWR_03900 [Acidimicrobiales bacterium]
MPVRRPAARRPLRRRVLNDVLDCVFAVLVIGACVALFRHRTAAAVMLTLPTAALCLAAAGQAPQRLARAAAVLPRRRPPQRRA